jgi:transposase
MANPPPCKVAMEACGTANYWARKFTSQGHEVKLVSPQFVKPFVKSNKNDRNDAEAIVEASSRPSMRYVTPKTVEQQDMQSLLRLRDGCMQMRTKLGNQLRGLLAEYGVVIPQGMSRLRKQLAELLGGLDEQNEGEVTDYLRELLFIPYELLQTIESQIAEYDKKIALIAKANQTCQRIQQIEGVGSVTAIAIVSTMGNPNDFKNGRHFAAFLGLVPKQSSSGSRQQLLGISKRGDSYTRQVLIHGARSVVNYASKKSDKRSAWVNQLKQRAGANRTAVAVANKNARIIWALLKYQEDYRKQVA